MTATRPLAFGVLGPLQVHREAEIAITRPAHRRLLSTLLLDHDRELTADTLIDRMWGDAPPTNPRNTLQAHVSALRRRVGGVITSTSSGYRLDLDGHELDLAEFEWRAREVRRLARAGSAGDAASEASVALALWRGPAFPDLVDDVHSLARIEALRRERLAVQIERVDALASIGLLEEAMEDLEFLVSEHPFEERIWERLMIARYRRGNQAAALRAFQTVRAILGDELGIEPSPRLREIESQILSQDPRLGIPARNAVANNIAPAKSSFVGRRRALDAVVSLLDSRRLVTIVGGPGMGKTRLAVEVATSMLDSRFAGVWMVRLAGAATEDDVAATIATTMRVEDDVAGLRELGRRLASRPHLVVLDNCEHVLDAVRSFASECIGAEGALRVLATSRQRLGLEEEHVWRLGPLELPDAGSASSHLIESDAVKLLADRASRIDPTFRIGDADPRDVVDLCWRTAGVPLAIELAATWIPSLSLADVAGVAAAPAPGALENMPERHMSLTAAVDWSARLLGDDDLALLDAASVFRGAFQLEAFRSVCAVALTESETAGAMVRLVESSVVAAERRSDGAFRYRILEPIRQQREPHLASSAEHDDVRARHAAWAVARAVALSASLDRDADHGASMSEVDEDIADLRAAMRWLLDHDGHRSAAEIASSLSRYWFARYLGWEAIRWLDEALTGDMDVTTRMGALWASGWAAYTRADYEASTARYEELLALARRENDSMTEGSALYGLARIELPRRPEVAIGHLDRALELFDSHPDGSLRRAECLMSKGLSMAQSGLSRVARPLLEEAAETMREHGRLRDVSVCLRYLSLAAWYDGDEAESKGLVTTAEQTARVADDQPAVSGSLIQRALVEARWGDLALAAAGLIEALEPVPAANDIDHCLIFFGVFPVLIADGRLELASRLFAHVDRIWDDYGWLPLDVRIPAAAGFRMAIQGNAAEAGPQPSREMAELVRSALDEIAGSASAPRVQYR